MFGSTEKSLITSLSALTLFSIAIAIDANVLGGETPCTSSRQCQLKPSRAELQVCLGGRVSASCFEVALVSSLWCLPLRKAEVCSVPVTTAASCVCAAPQFRFKTGVLALNRQPCRRRSGALPVSSLRVRHAAVLNRMYSCCCMFSPGFTFADVTPSHIERPRWTATPCHTAVMHIIC
jgi:hypothetical protein